ncbi:hypothetical protein QX183_04745 [Malacoplasma iowae]|nr:hypothetical protein [Malacoplasma iowae]WPL40426.1 hypothetical protein QX183_04745 [Malacoplasma iowae]
MASQFAEAMKNQKADPTKKEETKEEDKKEKIKAISFYVKNLLLIEQ